MSIIQQIGPRFKAAPSRHRNRQHKPRTGNSSAHLVSIRNLRCCITTAPAPSDPHHLKQDTFERGMAMRSSDRWAIPMSRVAHNAIEREPSLCEIQWFADRGIDCLQFARDLWTARDDFAEMTLVWGRHVGGVIYWA